MAQPTQAQVSALEAAMTEQFANLASAAAFRIGIARKFGLNSTEFLKFNNIYVSLVKKWINREVEYERELIKKHIYGIIASGDLKYEDFFYSEALPKLAALVKKWDKQKSTNGIGFIPLLIWAVIALVGFFTAQKIVDDLTTTTQEKEELLKATENTAKELGLTPAQAGALITQTQAEASQGSGIGDTIKWGLIAVGAIIILPKILESTK